MKLKETGYEFEAGTGSDEAELGLLDPENGQADHSDGLIVAGDDERVQDGQTHPKSAEEKANLISKLVFGWLDPLFRLGKRRALTEKDMYPLAKQDTCHQVGNKTEADWFAQVSKEKYDFKNTSKANAEWEVIFLFGSPSLIKAIVATFLKPFLIGGILKLMQDLLIFVGPFLLQRGTLLYCYSYFL